ncbi:hypothetical protein LTSEBAI_2938 [Salmonella enterica subsp. enterica serovar Baildon str. R6-199]|nr:hypothetical protein LTSEBAI_2938 [Salmonella enterica subsp. enterica serovar Baildon str. R6-199]
MTNTAMFAINGKFIPVLLIFYYEALCFSDSVRARLAEL